MEGQTEGWKNRWKDGRTDGRMEDTPCPLARQEAQHTDAPARRRGAGSSTTPRTRSAPQHARSACAAQQSRAAAAPTAPAHRRARCTAAWRRRSQWHSSSVQLALCVRLFVCLCACVHSCVCAWLLGRKRKLANKIYFERRLTLPSRSDTHTHTHGAGKGIIWHHMTSHDTYSSSSPSSSYSSSSSSSSSNSKSSSSMALPS